MIFDDAKVRGYQREIALVLLNKRTSSSAVERLEPLLRGLLDDLQRLEKKMDRNYEMLRSMDRE